MSVMNWRVEKVGATGDEEVAVILRRVDGEGRSPQDGDILRAVLPTLCPLSGSEMKNLVRLAEGKTYKQIAAERHRSASTIRSQLHHTYGKLGVVDRAQAVLVAYREGWIDLPELGGGGLA